MRISYPYGNGVGFVQDDRDWTSGPDESPEQRGVVKAYRSPRIPKVWAHSVPNGGHRDKQTASQMQAEGCDSGAADLMFWGQEGNPAALPTMVEMKKRYGNPEDARPEQVAWLGRYKACGIDSFVVCGEKACLALLRSRGYIL